MVKMTIPKNLNILIISAVFPPEPVVSAILSYDIASTLSVYNEVTVISPEPSRPLGFKFDGIPMKFAFKHIISNSTVCPVSNITGRFRESYSFGKYCFKYIADNHQNINVIYANTWPLFGQYFIIKAAKKFKIPVTIHVQDIYPESLSAKLPFAASFINLLCLPLDKYILSNSARIIAISEKMKKYLSHTRKLKSNKIEVIRNWQDETGYLNYTKETQGNHFTFMFLGSISPSAGVELLIKAFQKAELKNSQLIIAGNGSDREKCLILASQFKNCNIKFIDAPVHLVPEIQSEANVLLLPLKKGIGLTASPSKLPSYMFSSKPIIACVDKDGDTADTIISSNCGWVLPPENEDSLVQTMKMVAGISSEKLQQKGKNGFEFAISNFSKKKNLKKLCDIITETTRA